MELAIIGGLFGVGWAMSAKGSTSRMTREVPPVLTSDDADYPFDPDVTGAALLDRDVERTKKHVARTRADTARFLGNDVTPNVVSDRRMQMDSQRRMELFTGTEDTWRHRRETRRPFTPKETRGYVTSGGTFQNDTRYGDTQGLKDRAVFGGKMHNVLPFQQQRVGPGLGVDASVPSIDGVHSQFRVLPTDIIDESRINELPGRATTGGVLQGLDHSSRRYDHFERNRPSLVEYTPNVTGPRGFFDAATAHADPMLRTTRAYGTSAEYTGGGFATSVPGPAVPFDMRSLKKPLGELRGTASGNGIVAPTETAKAYTRDNGTRTGQTFGITGSMSAARKSYVTQTHRQTPRKLAENQSDHASAGAASATIRAGNGSTCYVLKDTSREERNPTTMPGAAATVPFGTTCAPQCLDASALREQPARNAGESSFLKKTSVTPQFSLGPGRETHGRTEIGALAGGRRGEVGLVQRPIPTNAYEKQPPSGYMRTAQQRAEPGYRTPHRKLSSTNPRTCPDSLGLGLTFDRTDNYVAVT